MVYYLISSLWDGMVNFIKKMEFRLGFKDFNKYIPGRENYKEQVRKSVFVRLSWDWLKQNKREEWDLKVKDSVVHLYKLIQHCKSTVLQIKKKKKVKD